MCNVKHSVFAKFTVDKSYNSSRQSVSNILDSLIKEGKGNAREKRWVDRHASE